MPSPPSRAEGGSPGALHAVALATLLTFGCATVRAPVSGIAPTVPVHGSTAEPQLELWLEGGSRPSAAESARAAADAREALRQALEDRRLGDDDVLVVRAQAVSRTGSRRAGQHAAVAGLVVGAVVLVALAVVVSAKGGSAPHLGGHAVRGAAAGFRPGAVPHGSGGFRPGALPLRPVSGPYARRIGPGGPGGADVRVDVEVVTPPDDPSAMQDGVALEMPPPTEDLVGGPPAPADERISEVTLPAPSPLSLDRRGFFDGDWLRLELVVVDARSGAVRWTKSVADEIDVRDARKVRGAVDDALATEDGWSMPSASFP